jgi:hypothetical protein
VIGNKNVRCVCLDMLSSGDFYRYEKEGTDDARPVFSGIISPKLEFPTVDPMIVTSAVSAVSRQSSGMAIIHWYIKRKAFFIRSFVYFLLIVKIVLFVSNSNESVPKLCNFAC